METYLYNPKNQLGNNLITLNDLPIASTTSTGIVQLSASTNSLLTSTAATSSAVKAAYDLADSKMDNLYVYADYGNPYNSRGLNFTSGDLRIRNFLEDNGNITIEFTLNKDSAIDTLGLGSAAFLSTGTTSNTIPILGPDGKLAESVIPSVALVDIIEIPTANEMSTILTRVNSATDTPLAKQGDIILVLDGTMQGNMYLLSATKVPGNYVESDLLPIKIPANTINTIVINGQSFNATNGVATLGHDYKTSIMGSGAITVNNNLSIATISVKSASTSTPGVVQLNDTLTSTSTTQAATARAVNELQNNKISTISSDIKNTTELSLNIAGTVTERNIFLPTNTAFYTGPLITKPQDQKATTDYQVTNFLWRRTGNQLVTFTSEDIINGNGTYTYEWFNKTIAPKVLDIILSDGSKVIIPVIYDAQKIKLVFYPNNSEYTRLYGGLLNTLTNQHTMILSTLDIV